jgi:hypothetical protein
LIQAVQNYEREAIKELFSARLSKFMQDGLTYEKLKTLLPIVNIAEDAYNSLKSEIDLAYAGDAYSAGRVHALCLTACIGGIEGSELAILRKLGPQGIKAAELLEKSVIKAPTSLTPATTKAKAMEFTRLENH